jgi:glycosyltransferase involved in cell wall biosynthesis
MARVTVAIPFLNAASTIEDAVRSVLSQTFSDWELILLDDGSTDDSLSRVKSIADQRISVVSDGKNLGLAKRLNQIAALANCEYLARMDADDLMHPERLSEQIAIMARNGQATVVGGRVIVVDGNLNPVGARGNSQRSTKAYDILRGGLFVHPSVTYRTSWATANPYPESDEFTRIEDVAHWLAKRKTLVPAWSDKVVLYYREPYPVRIQGYIRSAQGFRSLVRSCPADALGAGERARLLVKSTLGEACYRIAPSNIQAAFLKNRNQRITQAERVEAQKTISRIRSCILTRAVPGYK